MSNEIELNAFLFEKDKEIKELKEEIERLRGMIIPPPTITDEELDNILLRYESDE